MVYSESANRSAIIHCTHGLYIGFFFSFLVRYKHSHTQVWVNTHAYTYLGQTLWQLILSSFQVFFFFCVILIEWSSHGTTAFPDTATAEFFNGIVHFRNTSSNPHIEIYSPFQNMKLIHSNTGLDEKKGNTCPLIASFILWMRSLQFLRLSFFA